MKMLPLAGQEDPRRNTTDTVRSLKAIIEIECTMKSTAAVFTMLYRRSSGKPRGKEKNGQSRKFWLRDQRDTWRRSGWTRKIEVRHRPDQM